MIIDVRPRRLGLALLGLAPLAWACAPPCYDDGVLQSGCPEEAETEAVSGGSGSASGSSTSPMTADGTGDSGIMTMSGGSGGSESADGTSGGVQCPGHMEVIAPQTRTYEVVLEQSGAMAFDLDGVSRYDAVAEALLDPVDGVVTQQPATRFGQLIYHGLQAGCPEIETVAPQPDAAAAMGGLMAMNPPQGSNPVPDAVDVAVTELTADMAAGDKSIILIIGTEPGSCEILSPADAIQQATTRADSVAAVEAAFMAGFPTQVVVLDNGIQEAFLQLMANTGIGHQPGDPDAPYWVVQTREELAMAVTEITAPPVRSCDFALADPISGELAPNCEVVVNGGPVMYQDPDGWDLPDDQTLQLSGAACDSIQMGLATINMTCACDA